MNTQKKIEIHEFSTGIEVKGTSTAWESGGFTGEYMNRTIDKVPRAVLDSIANREFALAEGVVKTDPAIVGRVVRGYGEIWSVVAVVTRGRDDRGRGVSLYRYFMCRGDRGIETILRWMGKPLVFDPFENKAIGQPHQVNLSSQEVPLNEFQEILNQLPPIVFPASERCTSLILNEITRRLKPNGDRSWAYKVAMLERPEYFQVIYPADFQAETVIREVLSRRQSSSVLTPGESGIKTAIKAVMSGRVKQEHIGSLENALVTSQLNKNYWKPILDKEGASQAFKENVYGDRYVRLLTLKAILVPEFLPNFLAWLANSKESETHYNTSLKLQEWISRETQKFTEDFPELSKHLKKGICRVIDRLVDEPQKSKISKESELLLTSESGLWRQVYPSLSEELEEVIRLMGDYIKQRQNWHSLKSKHPQWSSLLDKINKFWYPPEQKDPKYRSLGELFEKVGTAELAAIFYQIGEGSVPKSLFDKFSRNNSKYILFNKRIHRRKDVGDYIETLNLAKIFSKIGGGEVPESRTPLEEAMESKGILGNYFYFLFCGNVNLGGIMPKIILWILLMFVFTGGYALGNRNKPSDTTASSGDSPSKDNNRSNGEKTPKNSNNVNGSDTKGRDTLSNQISPENLKNYTETNAAIDNIIKELDPTIQKQRQTQNLSQKIIDSTLTKSEDIVRFCVKDILELDQNFQYGDIGKYDEKWKTFSIAVYKYQKDKGGKKPDGIIDQGKDTQKWLKKDIGKQCLNKET